MEPYINIARNSLTVTVFDPIIAPKGRVPDIPLVLFCFITIHATVFSKDSDNLKERYELLRKRFLDLLNVHVQQIAAK